MKRTGPDLLLVQQQVAPQFFGERFDPLRIAGIEDLISGILKGIRLRTRSIGIGGKD